MPTLVGYSWEFCFYSVEICDSQQLEGYPTIYLYQDGDKIEEYLKERNYEDLSEYVISTAGRFRIFKDDIMDLHAKSFETFVKKGIWYIFSNRFFFSLLWIL